MNNLNISKCLIRCQLLSLCNAGNAQLLTSQPVFTNQMIQAMASQLQQFPNQPIMLTQGSAQQLNTGTNI